MNIEGNRLGVIRQIQVLQSVTQGWIRVNDPGLLCLLKQSKDACAKAVKDCELDNKGCMDAFDALLDDARIPVKEFKRDYSGALGKDALDALAAYAYLALYEQKEFKIFDDGFLKAMQ